MKPSHPKWPMAGWPSKTKALQIECFCSHKLKRVHPEKTSCRQKKKEQDLFVTIWNVYTHTHTHTLQATSLIILKANLLTHLPLEISPGLNSHICSDSLYDHRPTVCLPMIYSVNYHSPNLFSHKPWFTNHDVCVHNPHSAKIKLPAFGFSMILTQSWILDSQFDEWLKLPV